MKKRWKILIGIVAVLLLLVIGYVVYVLTAYHRIGDVTLAAENNAKPAEFAEVDTGFAYSDHNPVTMTFKLK